MFNLFENFSTDDLPKEPSTESKPEATTVDVTTVDQTSVNDVNPTNVDNDVDKVTDPIVDNDVDTDTTNTSNEGEEVDEIDDFSFSPVVDALAEAGVLIYDEAKEYEDSEEGFAEVIKDTVGKKVKEELESLGEEAIKAFEHIKKGGKLADLIELEASKVDFSKVDIKDKGIQEELITDHLLATGLTQEEVDEQLETLRDLGEDRIEKQAGIAKRFLAKEQDKREAEFQARIEKEEAARIAQAKAEVSRIEDTIFKSEDIAGFKLSKEERQQFRDYLLKADKSGKTQYQKDLANEKSAVELALLKFKKVDAKYVDKSIETKKTIGLKKALSKYKDNNAETKSKLPVEVAKETVNLPKSWMF